MRRFIALALSVTFALAACQGTHSMRYRMSFDAPQHTEELTQAALRVVARRLEAMKEPLLDISVAPSENGSIMMTIEVPDQEAIDRLSEEITRPFELEIMRKIGEGEQGDVSFEGMGTFAKTGINAKDIAWITSSGDGDGKGQVGIQFTAEGRTKMQALLKKNIGNDIAIVTRGKLVSKLRVTTADMEEEMTIQNIPDAEIASMFADDMNVSIHTSFTPVP